MLGRKWVIGFLAMPKLGRKLGFVEVYSSNRKGISHFRHPRIQITFQLLHEFSNSSFIKKKNYNDRQERLITYNKCQNCTKSETEGNPLKQGSRCNRHITAHATAKQTEKAQEDLRAACPIRAEAQARPIETIRTLALETT